MCTSTIIRRLSALRHVPLDRPALESVVAPALCHVADRPALESDGMSNDPRDTPEQRRAARSRWPIARFRFGEEPSDDLSAVTTPGERVAMMWFLAHTAWSVTGRPWPRYDRAHIPARLFRPGTPPPDDDDA